MQYVVYAIMSVFFYCIVVNILLLPCMVLQQMLTGRNRQMMQYIKDMFLTQDLPVMLSNESTFTTMDMIRSYTPKLHREDQVCVIYGPYKMIYILCCHTLMQSTLMKCKRCLYV
jgi:hypothetical protein